MTSENLYETRKETFVVAQRMGGYKNREKWLAVLEQNKHKTSIAITMLRKNIGEITAPKSLIVDIYYPEPDYDQPIDHCFPQEPGVVLKEVCVDTGKVLREFKVSLAEAKAISALIPKNIN